MLWRVLVLLLILIFPAAASDQCAFETKEERITEALQEEARPYFIVEGAKLAEFLSNLEMLSGYRLDADKLYVVDAIRPNEVILFFIKDHCIVYVIQTLKVAVEHLKETP